MSLLNSLDYWIIAIYIVATLFIGIFYFRQAGKSMEEFFLSGRNMPWWLIGISMAATNFSIDTPLAVAKIIAKNGLPGAWVYWSGGIAAIAATFLFSRLWRRAQVITDNELIELRYSGRPAAVLRLFKGIYFGVIINGFILGWVFHAVAKVSSVIVPGWNNTALLVFFAFVTLLYTVMGGFYGVVLTDFLQYVVAIFGSIALAVYAVAHVGGFAALVTKLETLYEGQGFTNFMPHFNGTNELMPIQAFFVLVLVKWWAHKFSDGGGKHIQRMSAAKNERHAVFGTFFYSTFTNIIAMWPWIVTALCAVVVFQGLPDPEKGYPLMMVKVLPHGLLGLCVVSLLAAFMSTVDTHLNLGASYFVNDIYKRFLVKDASHAHYVMASRISVVLVLLMSVLLSLKITSVASAFFFILTFASGAGVTWILRWFWWRINAFTELSAMIVSAIVASTIKIKYPEMRFEYALVLVISITTPIFLLTTFLTRPTDEKVLRHFYERVQPSVLGWKPIIKKFNLSYTPYFRHAILNFHLGVALLLLSNLGLGVLMLKSFWWGLAMIGGSVALTIILIFRVRSDKEASVS